MDHDEIVVMAPEVPPVAAATGADVADPAFNPLEREEEEDPDALAPADVGCEAETEAVIADEVDWV